ncbi:MAG: CRISPR system precrRNA processing endoribonuclease RAMP protein Cas6 [Deltaproteobacteria bacterium]|nr:CRISPR system precrRNA processing endoribonuclease RAMP protein Cas6 [Deltaproteobacteria bacterium]
MHETSVESGLPLTYGQFSAVFAPEGPLRLPVYTGSMFRGAFGSALKQAVCVTRTYECAPCLLKSRCLYPYVFETPPPPESRVMRKYTAAPHPFVFEPPAGGITAPAAQPLVVGMTLFGKAIGSLSHFIFALERLGQQGLGGRRVRCALSRVESCLDGRKWSLYGVEDRTPRSADAFEKLIVLPLRPPFALGEQLPIEQATIELLTPLRIVYDSRLADELPFHVLVRSLLRRIGHLSHFHCGGDPSGVDFKEWIELASTVHIVEHGLKWFDWERYSSRQQTTMRMGGLMGRVTFEGKLAPFYPLLAAGEVIHAGKGTSFGLGRYQVLGR